MGLRLFPFSMLTASIRILDGLWNNMFWTINMSPTTCPILYLLNLKCLDEFHSFSLSSTREKAHHVIDYSGTCIYPTWDRGVFPSKLM